MTMTHLGASFSRVDIYDPAADPHAEQREERRASGNQGLHWLGVMGPRLRHGGRRRPTEVVFQERPK